MNALENEVKYLLILIAYLLSITSVYSQESEADRNVKQGQLDRACLLARQKALSPLRQDIFDECMAKQNDKTACRNEADGFDGARVGRSALFYDLPECQAAFEHEKGG